VIMNFVDAVSKGALSENLARKFVRMWACKCSSISSCDEALWKLRSVRESDPDFLASTGCFIAPNDNFVYTIIRYDQLQSRLDNDTFSGLLASVHSSACDFENAVSEKKREILESRVLGFQDKYSDSGFFEVKFKRNETIKGNGKKLIWVSSADPGKVLSKDNTHFRSTAANPADIARDSLGLVHLGSNQPQGQTSPLVVGLRIKATEVLGNIVSLWRPTAIDAENHSRFRGAYGDLRRKACGWGHAVHLETLSDQRGDLGAVEAVIPDLRPKMLATNRVVRF